MIKQRILEANPTLGYYVVCFWKDESWKEVIIDDQLFVTYAKWNRYPKTSLAFGSVLNEEDPDTPGPIWLPIIEKAYAKLHGGYTSLEGGKLVCCAVILSPNCMSVPVIRRKGSHRCTGKIFWIHE